uniref:Mediator of DNA damage checkpoint protein 1 n=1 Tax=Erpetoichthys calabaricus TaxID=27687 RepID=A0A8C4X357_ERPCA
MEQTQLIDEPFFIEETDNEVSIRRPMARIKVFNNAHCQEKDFLLFLGENTVGREETCTVAVPVGSVSKCHAVIEIESDSHLLWDCGSLNGTRKGRKLLKPRVHYDLQNGDLIMFADVPCQYIILNNESPRGSQKDSENASHTMAATNTVADKSKQEINCSSLLSHNGCTLEQPNNKSVGIKLEEEVDADEEEDDSLLPDTQTHTVTHPLTFEKTPVTTLRRYNLPLVSDSDSEEEDDKRRKQKKSAYTSDSSSPSVSDPKNSTFMSPGVTVIPESEDESSITPGSGPDLQRKQFHYDSNTDLEEEPLVSQSKKSVPSIASFASEESEIENSALCLKGKSTINKSIKKSLEQHNSKESLDEVVEVEESETSDTDVDDKVLSEQNSNISVAEVKEAKNVKAMGHSSSVVPFDMNPIEDNCSRSVCVSLGVEKKSQFKPSAVDYKRSSSVAENEEGNEKPNLINQIEAWEDEKQLLSKQHLELSSPCLSNSRAEAKVGADAATKNTNSESKPTADLVPLSTFTLENDTEEECEGDDSARGIYDAKIKATLQDDVFNDQQPSITTSAVDQRSQVASHFENSIDIEDQSAFLVQRPCNVKSSEMVPQTNKQDVPVSSSVSTELQTFQLDSDTDCEDEVENTTQQALCTEALSSMELGHERQVPTSLPSSIQNINFNVHSVTDVGDERQTVIKSTDCQSSSCLDQIAPTSVSVTQGLTHFCQDNKVEKSNNKLLAKSSDLCVSEAVDNSLSQLQSPVNASAPGVLNMFHIDSDTDSEEEPVLEGDDTLPTQEEGDSRRTSLVGVPYSPNTNDDSDTDVEVENVLPQCSKSYVNPQELHGNNNNDDARDVEQETQCYIYTTVNEDNIFKEPLPSDLKGRSQISCSSSSPCNFPTLPPQGKNEYDLITAPTQSFNSVDIDHDDIALAATQPYDFELNLSRDASIDETPTQAYDFNHRTSSTTKANCVPANSECQSENKSAFKLTMFKNTDIQPDNAFIKSGENSSTGITDIVEPLNAVHKEDENCTSLDSETPSFLLETQGNKQKNAPVTGKGDIQETLSSHSESEIKASEPVAVAESDEYFTQNTVPVSVWERNKTSESHVNKFVEEANIDNTPDIEQDNVKQRGYCAMQAAAAADVLHTKNEACTEEEKKDNDTIPLDFVDGQLQTSNTENKCNKIRADDSETCTLIGEKKNNNHEVYKEDISSVDNVNSNETLKDMDDHVTEKAGKKQHLDTVLSTWNISHDVNLVESKCFEKNDINVTYKQLSVNGSRIDSGTSFAEKEIICSSHNTEIQLTVKNSKGTVTDLPREVQSPKMVKNINAEKKCLTENSLNPISNTVQNTAIGLCLEAKKDGTMDYEFQPPNKETNPCDAQDNKKIKTAPIFLETTEQSISLRKSNRLALASQGREASEALNKPKSNRKRTTSVSKNNDGKNGDNNIALDENDAKAQKKRRTMKKHVSPKTAEAVLEDLKVQLPSTKNKGTVKAEKAGKKTLMPKSSSILMAMNEESDNAKINHESQDKVSIVESEINQQKTIPETEERGRRQCQSNSNLPANPKEIVKTNETEAPKRRNRRQGKSVIVQSLGDEHVGEVSADEELPEKRSRKEVPIVSCNRRSKRNEMEVCNVEQKEEKANSRKLQTSVEETDKKQDEYLEDVTENMKNPSETQEVPQYQVRHTRRKTSLTSSVVEDDLLQTTESFSRVCVRGKRSIKQMRSKDEQQRVDEQGGRSEIIEDGEKVEETIKQISSTTTPKQKGCLQGTNRRTKKEGTPQRLTGPATLCFRNQDLNLTPRSLISRTRCSSSPRASGIVKIMFTGVEDDLAEKTIHQLGGEMAESVQNCTHLITDRVRRTVKFLCALARGIPIVTPDWLDKCGKNGCFLSPNPFLVKDREQEKNFSFSLADSLAIARKKSLLEGFEIHVTPNVKPDPPQMKEIIECSGAVYLPKMPGKFKEKNIVVSCVEDITKCKTAFGASIPVVNSEFLLTGILQQSIELERYCIQMPGIERQGPADGQITSGSKKKRR